MKQILICDPGRWPFEDLAELFVSKKKVELLNWETKKPTDIKGQILKIEF